MTAETFLAKFRPPAGRVAPIAAGRSDLVALWSAMGATRGAEIGVWTGKFSEQLCQGIPGLRLVSVDPWRAYDDYRERKNDTARLEAAYQETRRRLAPFAACEIWRSTSAEAAARVPDGSLDFVYIDGNHAKAYVLADLGLWLPKVRPGGIVAGHDYMTSAAHPWLQVQAAVDQFTALRDIHPVYVFAADKAPSFAWVVA